MEEEVILNKIIQDATDEANRILDEAKKKAHEIEEKYKQQISKKTDSEIDNIKREIKRNKETDIEKAELESRVVILEKKHEKIKAVKDEVKKKIKSLSVKELIDIYKKIISQYKNKNELEVLLPEKNKAEISKELAKIGIKVSNENLEYNTGIIIRDGNIEYNYCFEEAMNFNNEKIEKSIANILFS